MKAPGLNGSPPQDRLSTFEILYLILEAVDNGLVIDGHSDPQLYPSTSSPTERGRWIYAWNFIVDEEMVEIDSRVEKRDRWRLGTEGRILMDQIRRGSFTSEIVSAQHRGAERETGITDRRTVSPWSGRHL